jgi:DNA uptake protein ComE-like DNA-binding protein
MHNARNRGFSLMVAVLAMASTSSYAVNKCTDASGQTTFTDMPCPAAARSEKLALPTDSTAPPAAKTSAGAARTVDANTATEADLSTVVSPAVAAQIVGSRSKRRFLNWADLVDRGGLRTAKSALFASLRGLTVDGKSLPGAPPDPARADQLDAKFRAGRLTPADLKN